VSLTLSASGDELVKQFFALRTRQDVAELLEIDDSRLVYHLYIVSYSEKYTTFDIPKKSGGVRKISAPATALKIIQQKLNQVLQHVYESKAPVHGFVYGKNIVTNAQMHRRKKYVFNVDLKDFFPSINFGRVRGMFMAIPYNLNPNVATVLAQICCFDNQLPQGAPTSPIISNMICAKMDSQLRRLAQRHRCIYTRYADDITFSTSTRSFPDALASVNPAGQMEVGSELRRVIEENGFEINPDKVRLQTRKYCRQEVTGLTVNEFPNVRRKYVRQIRAMLHAWEKFRLEAAQEEFSERWDDKHRDPQKGSPSFKQVVKGKIEFLGMVRGKDDHIYLRFCHQLRELAPELVRNLVITVEGEGTTAKPLILTEGKTDAMILNTAWTKLFSGRPIPFDIKGCDPLPEGLGGGAGGTDTLTSSLKTVRADSPRVVIGILDQDHEGATAYERLPSYFEEVPDIGAKVSQNRKAAAFLLPVPPGKEEYAGLPNLVMEFYFSEEALSRKTDDGYGLMFRQPDIEVTVKSHGTPILRREPSTLPKTRQVVDGKTVFAETIVPTLDPAEFEPFRLVFDKTQAVLDYLQD
jgi:RNA-directed DNA polymerase